MSQRNGPFSVLSPICYRYNITNVTRYPDELSSPLDNLGRKHGHRHGRKKPKLKCRDPINRDKPHCRFKTRPRYYNSSSPARTNVPLSALGYTQFYLPGVDGPKNVTPEWTIEYSTFKVDKLLSGLTGASGQPSPVPVHLLPSYDEEIAAGLLAEMWAGAPDDEEQETVAVGDGGDSGDDRARQFKKELRRITPWRMRDLTIGSWVHLARKLVAEKKMWKQFSDFM